MERTQGSDFFAHMKKHDIISVFYVWVTPSESCLKLVVTRIKYQHEDIKSRICGKTPWFYICSKCGFHKEILVKRHGTYNLGLQQHTTKKEKIDN